jgi:hypothetical protein
VAEETASAGEEEMPAQEGASTPEPAASESGRGMKRKSEDIQSTANNDGNASKAAIGKADAERYGNSGDVVFMPLHADVTYQIQPVGIKNSAI